MSGVNKAIILGRLGKDPEIKLTQSGKKYAFFSIATSETFNGKEKTEWHKIAVWEKLADVAEKYLKKGNRVYVEGKFQTRSYEEQGVKKFITEIIASQISLCEFKKSMEENQGDNSYEDIPF